jgi:hypothetical protein
VKPNKHTFISDSIVSLAADPMFYDWSWYLLNMLAVTLKEPGHVDFNLNNVRKLID